MTFFPEENGFYDRPMWFSMLVLLTISVCRLSKAKGSGTFSDSVVWFSALFSSQFIIILTCTSHHHHIIIIIIVIIITFIYRLPDRLEAHWTATDKSTKNKVIKYKKTKSKLQLVQLYWHIRDYNQAIIIDTNWTTVPGSAAASLPEDLAYLSRHCFTRPNVHHLHSVCTVTIYHFEHFNRSYLLTYLLTYLLYGLYDCSHDASHSAVGFSVWFATLWSKLANCQFLSAHSLLKLRKSIDLIRLLNHCSDGS